MEAISADSQGRGDQPSSFLEHFRRISQEDPLQVTSPCKWRYLLKAQAPSIHQLLWQWNSRPFSFVVHSQTLFPNPTIICFPPLSLLNRAGKNINGNPWNGTCLWWSRSSICASNSGRELNPNSGLFAMVLSAQPVAQQKRVWRPCFSDLLSHIQFNSLFRTVAELQRENVQAERLVL